MTLNRLMIGVGILVLLVGIGIAWLWQYAYSPEGRARIILAQMKGDTNGLRGWLLEHHLVRAGYAERTSENLPASEFPDAPEAAEEMKKLGPKCMPVVLSAAEDESGDVQMMVILVCKGLGGPAAVRQLTKMMDPQEDLDIRIAAAEALASFNDKRTVDTFIRCAEEADFIEMRTTAIEALAEIGDPKAIPPLLKIVRNRDRNDWVRAAAAGSLAKMGRQEGTDYLLSVVKGATTGNRDVAIRQLSDPRFRVAVDALLPLLRDRKRHIRAEAAESLGKIGDKRAAPPIRELLHDSDPSVRDAARAALERLGDRSPSASAPPASRPAGGASN